MSALAEQEQREAEQEQREAVWDERLFNVFFFGPIVCVALFAVVLATYLLTKMSVHSLLLLLLGAVLASAVWTGRTVARAAAEAHEARTASWAAARAAAEARTSAMEAAKAVSRQ